MEKRGRKKKALTVHEEINMYGGAHCTNFDQAKKAMEQGRDIIVNGVRYDGQRNIYYSYRVQNLRYNKNKTNIIGDFVDPEQIEVLGCWEATKELCEYAKTGKI